MLKNPLDVLFKEIARDLYLERSKPLPPKAPVQSTYANPRNWTLGKVIRLVHRDEGSLGNFQEYFHRLSPSARRLMPAAEGLEPCRDELVWGEFWLHPKFQAEPLSDSDAEITAIIHRFSQLMDDYYQGITTDITTWDSAEDDE